MRQIFDLSNCTFLCAGEVILDHFVYGGVERISPEAPVPVLHVKKDFYALGGAGNVVRNLAAIGAKSNFLCVIGDDSDSSYIQNLVEDEDLISMFTVKEKNRRIPRKSRFIGQNQQILRVDYEDLHVITQKTEDAFEKAFLKQKSSADVIIISDYNKGVLSHRVCQSIIKNSTVPVVVDPKGCDFSKYTGATCLTPNIKELKEAVSFEVISDEDVTKAARGIMKQFKIANMLLTRGADGMTLFTKDDEYTVKNKAREVFDVSGAGDTVIATFSACIAKGMDLKEATRIANIAGGIVVGKIGTATVTVDEIQEVLNGQSLDVEDKIVSFDDAKDISQRWQSQGNNVGFTNGCFDLLHLGHLHNLKSAAAKCDKLVLGINSDKSVKGLKGNSRPIQSEQARAKILANLELVDLVVVFSEETPLRLIKKVMPNVLFKGADYTVENVVGADIVMASGGKVELIELLPGHSTTGTVAKLTK